MNKRAIVGVFFALLLALLVVMVPSTIADPWNFSTPIIYGHYSNDIVVYFNSTSPCNGEMTLQDAIFDGCINSTQGMQVLTYLSSQGFLPYWSTSSHLMPSILYYDASTGRIGVGTNTPAEKLDIAGNVVVSGDILTGLPGDWDNAANRRKLNFGNNRWGVEVGHVDNLFLNYGTSDGMVFMVPQFRSFAFVDENNNVAAEISPADGKVVARGAITTLDRIGVKTLDPQNDIHVEKSYATVFAGNASTGATAIQLVGSDPVLDAAFIRAGTDASDTSAKLRISRYGTVNQNVQSLVVFADESSFTDNVNVGGDLVAGNHLRIGRTITANQSITSGVPGITPGNLILRGGPYASQWTTSGITMGLNNPAAPNSIWYFAARGQNDQDRSLLRLFYSPDASVQWHAPFTVQPKDVTSAAAGSNVYLGTASQPTTVFVGYDAIQPNNPNELDVNGDARVVGNVDVGGIPTIRDNVVVERAGGANVNIGDSNVNPRLRLVGSDTSGYAYVQSGRSDTDTNARLRIARYSTQTQPISQFEVFAERTAISGSTVIGGSLNVTGGVVNATSGIDVTGTSRLNGGLFVSGISNFQASVLVGAPLTVSGATLLQNALTATSSAEFRSGVTLTSSSGSPSAGRLTVYASGAGDIPVVIRTLNAAGWPGMHIDGSVIGGTANPSGARWSMATNPNNGAFIIDAPGAGSSANVVLAKSGDVAAGGIAVASSGNVAIKGSTNAADALRVYGQTNVDTLCIDGNCAGTWQQQPLYDRVRVEQEGCWDDGNNHLLTVTCPVSHPYVLNCLGGPGDIDEQAEGFFIDADISVSPQRCMLNITKPRCDTPTAFSDRQRIIGICHK